MTIAGNNRANRNLYSRFLIETAIANNWCTNRNTMVLLVRVNTPWCQQSYVPYHKTVVPCQELSVEDSRFHRHLGIPMFPNQDTMDFFYNGEHYIYINVVYVQMTKTWTIWQAGFKFPFILYIAKLFTEQFTNMLLTYLRIDRNFCSVHEEITSIRLYTPYKLIKTFFVMILKNTFIFSK